MKYSKMKIESIYKKEKDEGMKFFLNIISKEFFGEVIIDDNINDVLEKQKEGELKAFLGKYKQKKEEIIIENSKLDLNKLIYAIQAPREGVISLQAFTDFNCKICSKKEKWHNSAVPHMCKECAEEIAKKIIFKDVSK